MKLLTSFLLGAAAGIAVYKYNSMTRDEREELMCNLKSKATSLKEDAEAAVDKAKDYFEKLKEKTAEAEKKMKNMFNKGETAV